MLLSAQLVWVLISLQTTHLRDVPAPSAEPWACPFCHCPPSPRDVGIIHSPWYLDYGGGLEENWRSHEGFVAVLGLPEGNPENLWLFVLVKELKEGDNSG